MAFQIEYFHPRVLEQVTSWPVDVLADFARMLELLAEYGPHLGMPDSRALGEVCSNSGRADAR